MGITISSMVFYGICPDLDEPLSYPEERSDEDFAEDEEDEATNSANQEAPASVDEAWQRHFDRVKANYTFEERVEKEWGIELLSHGWTDYPYPFLAISTTYKDDEVIGLSPEFLAVDPAWDEQLRRYCQTFELPFEQPQWWVATYMSA